MRLDRNVNADQRQKYALIKLRVDQPKVRIVQNPIEPILAEVASKAIDFGNTPDTEFFVIRLKDKYAATALHAYANAVGNDDTEYAQEIKALADKADTHPNRRMPD